MPLTGVRALATHQGWLRRVVAARVGEPQAVDEVMQEVALAAVAQRSPLHNPARAAVWLYRLAVRHVLLYRRKTGRAAVAGRAGMRPARRRAPSTRQPRRWHGCSATSVSGWFKTALKRLPPRDAEMLILKHAEGLSAREIAERLGVAVATVETRLHRARGRLRAELAGLGRRIRGKRP